MNAISFREQEILQLLSLEYSVQQISKQLYISKYTVESHRKNLRSKLNARNTAGLIRKGFEHGYLSLTSKSL